MFVIKTGSGLTSLLTALGLTGCNDPDCAACSSVRAATGKTGDTNGKTAPVGEEIGRADGSMAQVQSTDGDSAFAKKVRAEEADQLAMLAQVSKQARQRTAGDISNYLRQQIRSLQIELIDLEHNDARTVPVGHAEMLQARIEHLRNFKALFAIAA